MAQEEIIFPNNIRNIRLKNGMKMTELARRTGLSLSAVSKIEKGVRRLNQKQLLNICNILGCKLSDIFIKESDEVAEQEGWTGTFKAMDGNAIAGKYILNIKGDKMQKAGNGASLAPYHCYLELPTGTDVSKFSVSHREHTTGVKNIKEQNYSEEIFDLHGRKLNYMPNCGIIIKNNKKIYIK